MSRVSTIVFTAILIALSAVLHAEDWPQWRGPNGDGTTSDSAPIEWTATEHVKWRIELPERSNSSPVVFGNRIFVAQPLSESNKRTLICFDRGSGEQLWEKSVEYEQKETSHRTNPYCSPSPATDGERVVVWYGSAGLHCYDVSGEHQWSRDLGKQQHMWGYGSSPILYGDLCILNFGPGIQEFLIAVDKRTGDTVWQVDKLSLEKEMALSGQANNGNADASRDEGKTAADWLRGSWTTPIVYRANGRDELILNQTRRVTAYDPATGNQLWVCGGYGPLAYCSPIPAENAIVALGGYEGGSLAVEPGGRGDVTDTQRLWHKPRDGAWLGTGIARGGYVYVVDMNGFLNCIEVSSGDVKWKKRLTASGGRNTTWGSLIQSGDGLMYVMNQSGDTFVFQPSPEGYQQIARNSIGESTNSTPVISDGQIFLRTHEALWCIE